MDVSDNNELLKSPLQQLELQTSKARNSKSPPSSPTPKSKSILSNSFDHSNSKDNNNPCPMNQFDRDSIYSFDSVSTNGRLLDRLGLENEDLFDQDDLTVNRFDRLSISDIGGKNGTLSRNGSIQSNAPILQNPFRQNSTSKPISTSNSAVNLDRFPSYKANSIFNIKPNLSLNGQVNSKDNHAFAVKNVPSNVVYPSRNKSIDSFHASILVDTASLISQNSNNIISPRIDSNAQQFDDEYDEFNFNSSADSIETKQIYNPKSKSATKTSGDLSRNGSIQSESTINITRNRSVSAAASSTANMSPRSPLTKRSISDYTQTSSPNGKLVDLDADARLKLSGQLRSVGKHREASYQLQIAANSPFYNTKAMYLYAMALKFGHGVRQNDLNSLKWLCRCVLVHHSGTGKESINRIIALEVDDLLKLISNHINSDNSEIDPTKLCDYYSKLPSNQITKLINSIKAQVDVIPLAYQEIGNFWINGWANIEKNEQLGIKALSISSYMGNFNAMVSLGELWSTKTKTRKKDYYKSSAWYRLSEIFGIKSIGNSWIYKEKYLEKK